MVKAASEAYEALVRRYAISSQYLCRSIPYPDVILTVQYSNLVRSSIRILTAYTVGYSGMWSATSDTSQS